MRAFIVISLMENTFDVIVIGAGVIGSFIARELSKYSLDVLVIEKDSDVGNETSSANSAIIHSGYDPKPGTLKAKFNVLGNKMYPQILKDLEVHYYNIGSLTIALNDEQQKTLSELKERAKENGVEVKLLSKEETLALEPKLNPNITGALLAPSACIVDPFNLVIHCMENAMENGVHLKLNEKVLSISKESNLFLIKTNKDQYTGKVVINAAGCSSDKIGSMVEPIDWNITPRKGEYYVLDHFDNKFLKHTIFTVPTEKGKGVLVSPSSTWNYLVGPSSEPNDDYDDASTDSQTLLNVKKQASDLVPNIPFNQVIRVFSGNRATCSRHDFIIECSKTYDSFINCAGIESPGLASAPAIAKYVVEELVSKTITLTKKENFNPCVKHYNVMKDLSLEDRNAFINKNPEYGEIVCNCEQISLGEIKESLSRLCKPCSVKGIKRRVRPGFGKCQGSFCQNKIVMILADYYKIDPLKILYNNESSNVLVSETKKGDK